MVTDANRPSRAYDVRVDRNSEGVLLVRGREAFELNDVGSMVWSACDGETPVSQIVATVVSAYDVSLDEASRDVNELVADMIRAGLLETE